MRSRISRRWLLGLLFLAAVSLVLVPAFRAQSTTGPSFSTLATTAGTAGSTLFVFLPITNSGGSTATNVQVTSVTLVGAPLVGPTLPLALGTMTPGAVAALNLSFNDGNLKAGTNYLITVRGSYQSGTSTLGFAVSRIISFGKPTVFELPANPVNVSSTLDTAHGVTQGISAAKGGTMTTTGADGTVFTLTIPANGLLSNETITMTPVASINGLPISGGLLAAVQFSPEGLRFQQTATLTIQPPTSVPVNQQVGFGYHANGQEFHFQPLRLTAAITVPMQHFSGVGVGQGTAGNAGTPTSLEDRLDNVTAPIIAQQRDNMFPNDPPSNAQLTAQLEGTLQQYYEQVVAPLVQAAETDDSQAQAGLNAGFSWARNVALLGLDQTDPFASEVNKFLTQQVPAILTNAYNAAFNRCVNDSSEPARILEAQKMVSAERWLQLLGNPPNPNFNTQVTACLAGPLKMDFDSMMVGSGFGFGGSLTLNSHVVANTVPLQFDTSSLMYRGTGVLIYDSLTGSFIPGPPAFDCGTTFVGLPGTIDVRGEFDSNINPLAITDPSQIIINVTVSLMIMEQITFRIAGPDSPCGVAPFQTVFYEFFWLLSRGLTTSSIGSIFEPIPVNINIPATVSGNAVVASGGVTLTANGTTIISLTSQ